MNQKNIKARYYFIVAILCLTFTLLISVPSSALVISFQLNTEYTGATPSGPLFATFDDGGTPDSVTLTMDATHLVGTEFVHEWSFNYDTDQFTLSPMDFTVVSGPPATTAAITVGVSTNGFKAAGDGWYDILVDSSEKESDRFRAGDTVTYQINHTGITAETFKALSYPNPDLNKAGPYPTVAHVGGIGDTGDDSGWMTVPEPSVIILFGSLLIALGLVVGIKRKKY